MERPNGRRHASGAIGAMVAGHCAQGQYLRTRIVPTNPRSLLQHIPRNTIARLANLWTSLLTTPQRESWATYAANVTWTNRLGDTVHLSGQMEFIRSNAPRVQGDILYGDPFDFPLMGIIADAPTTFDRGDPGPTPALGTIPGNDYLTMTYDNTADWVTEGDNNVMLVYANIPRGSGVTFFRRRSRLAGTIYSQDATGSFNFLNQWLPAIAFGQKWAAWWAIARADGRLSRWAPIPPFDTGTPPPPFWNEPFDYANGPLDGQDGWVDSGSTGNNWQISTLAAVSPVGPNATGVCTTPALQVFDLNSDWAFTSIVQRNLGADLGNTLDLQLGGILPTPGGANTSSSTYGPREMAALDQIDHFSVLDSNFDFQTITGPFPFTLNTDHTLLVEKTTRPTRVHLGRRPPSAPSPLSPPQRPIGFQMQWENAPARPPRQSNLTSTFNTDSTHADHVQIHSSPPTRQTAKSSSSAASRATPPIRAAWSLANVQFEPAPTSPSPSQVAPEPASTQRVLSPTRGRPRSNAAGLNTPGDPSLRGPIQSPTVAIRHLRWSKRRLDDGRF